MERKLKGNELFCGHRNPELRSRPRMPLSSGWERPFRRKAFLKKGFPVRLGSERCSGGQKDMSVPKQKKCGRDGRECMIEASRCRVYVNGWRTASLKAKG